MRNRAFVWGTVLLLFVGIGVGCNKGPTEEELALVELQGQLTTVVQTYDQLQQLRADLAAGTAEQAEIEAVKENKRTDEQKVRLEELAASLPDLTTGRDDSFGQLQEMMSDFLNIALNDFPKSEETKQVLEMYSKESMTTSDDMVAKAGDYKKAIDNLFSAKGYYEDVELAPYQPLLDKIAELDDWRYITQDRFEQLKKGMTKDEVTALVGVPYHGNIQELKKGSVTWLYKKREGGAAAVHFKTKTGKLYNLDFDAVKTKVVDS